MYLRILRKTGTDLQCTKRVPMLQKRNQRDREDSGTYIGHFGANKTFLQPRTLSTAMTINKIQSEMQQHDKLYFPSYFQLWGFPDSDVICLFSDTQYISLSITCPVSPDTCKISLSQTYLGNENSTVLFVSLPSRIFTLWSFFLKLEEMKMQKFRP